MIPISDLEEPARLKALLFGKAGAGKTTAAIMMPKPYIIDTEKGAVHYKDLIKKQGGALYHTNSMKEIVNIVKSLSTEKHPYLTLVIDPVTTIWKYAVDEAEARVGSKFGRHIGEAKKLVSKLENYMSQIDMNVICTSRAKDVFESDSQSPDAWKGLDYFFDIVVEIEREDDRRRFGRVEKSRISRIKELDRFPWSYDQLADRFGRDLLEKGVSTVALEDTASTETLTAREHARNALLELASVASSYNEQLSDEQRAFIEKTLQMTGQTAAEWESIEDHAKNVCSRLKQSFDVEKKGA